MKTIIERAPRTKTLLAGRVRSGRVRAETCIVENVSSGGARLKLQTTVSLPETFCLDILKWRETYRVRLVWRDGQSAGVQFSELLEWGAASAPTTADAGGSSFVIRPQLHC